MKKRFLSLFLAAILALTLVSHAIATDENTAKEAADALNALGLFKGTGIDSNGSPIYELDRAPRREEALVMLIRLLGVETDALASTATHPFTDVPDWLNKYVAYAYNKGLTNGMSATQFGGGTTATSNMYITFVLRALRYSDSGDAPDFTYDKACEFSEQIGLTNGEYTATSAFSRGDVAIISKDALGQSLKTMDQSLLETLIEQGAVPKEGAVPEEGAENVSLPVWSADGKTFTIEAEYDASTGYYSINTDKLKSMLPKITGVCYTGWSEDSHMFYSNTYSVDEMTALILMNNRYYQNGIYYFSLDNTYTFDTCFPVNYLVDDDMNFYGYMQRIDGTSTISVSTNFNVNSQKLKSDLDAVMSTIDTNWGKNVFTLSSKGYGGWEDNSGMAYRYPLMMNGKYVYDGVYCYSYKYWDARSEEQFRELINQAIFNAVFCSDYTSQDSDGNYFNSIFSDLFSPLQRFNDDTMQIENPPGKRGLVVEDVRTMHYCFVFLTRKGEYLGYIYLPPNV